LDSEPLEPLKELSKETSERGKPSEEGLKRFINAFFIYFMAYE